MLETFINLPAKPSKQNANLEGLPREKNRRGIISLQYPLIAGVSEDAIGEGNQLGQHSALQRQGHAQRRLCREKVTQISARTTRRIPGDMKERGRKCFKEAGEVQALPLIKCCELLQALSSLPSEEGAGTYPHHACWCCCWSPAQLLHLVFPIYFFLNFPVFGVSEEIKSKQY